MWCLIAETSLRKYQTRIWGHIAYSHLRFRIRDLVMCMWHFKDIMNLNMNLTLHYALYSMFSKFHFRCSQRSSFQYFFFKGREATSDLKKQNKNKKHWHFTAWINYLKVDIFLIIRFCGALIILKCLTHHCPPKNTP